MTKDEEMIEKRVRSEMLYEGRIVNLYSDDIVYGNGKPAKREVVTHPGGSCIVAINDQNEVYFVRQYRYVFEKFLLELPAGKRDNHEDPFLTAKRELAEETGMEAKTWVDLGSSLSSPGIFTERIFLYAAKDLTPVGQHLDDGEYLDVLTIPYDKAIEMVRNGELEDAKTQLALLKYDAFIKSQI